MKILLCCLLFLLPLASRSLPAATLHSIGEVLAEPGPESTAIAAAAAGPELRRARPGQDVLSVGADSPRFERARSRSEAPALAAMGCGMFLLAWICAIWSSLRERGGLHAATERMGLPAKEEVGPLAT